MEIEKKLEMLYDRSMIKKKNATSGVANGKEGL